MVAPGWRRFWKPALATALLVVVGAAARDPLVTRFGLSKVRLLRSATASKPLVLAILPVGNPTLDPQGEFLGAGIRSAVAGNLGAVGGITVLPRTDTAAYRKDRVDVAGLQRDLGATHVIDLSLVAVKPTPRLEARLYRAGGAKVEWEDTIEGDPLSIERTVLNDLARALETSALPRLFTADEWTRIQRLPTSSGAAFAAYSEAIALVARDPVENAGREIALLQVATEIDPRFAIAWATLGNAWWDKYQRDKDPALASNAIAAVDRAIALDANQADVHYALGIIRYRTGRLNEAVASFRAALNLRPEFDDAHRLLGEVLSTLGQVDAAEAELRTAIRIHKSWNNYFSLGTIDYRAGRYPQAADAFTQATELAPLNAGAFQMLGTTYYVLGDIQKAIGNFEHAVRLGPSASAYANLGMAYYESNKLDEARRSYDESLQRDPKSALNHRNLGDVYRRLGRMRDARAQYEQAIALAASLLSVNPRDVRAISLVAVCEAKLGRAAAAARHAAEAVALEPANRQALQRSAEVHALLNQPDAALRDLQAAIAHGFDPRMARNDDELASLRRLPRFEEILKASPGNPSATQGARE